MFYFDLPVINRIANTPHAESLLEDKPLKFLICEDDPDQANYLRLLLESAGYAADIAGSGALAKRMLANQSYNALLLDLLLPDEDGVTLIRELRANEETVALPIIVVSVIAETGRAILNGDAVSILDWLDKPVDMDKLLRSIRILKQQLNKGLPNILHIEDEDEIRKVVAQVLQAEAHVVSADSLKSARQKLSQEKFDLVILDLLLPDGHGTELLPLLSQRHIPVVVFSSLELDQKYAEFVSQALIKAKTSEKELLDIIKGLCNKDNYE